MAQNKIELAEWQVILIRRSLEMTCRELRKHQQTMEQCEMSGGNPMITPEAARNLAQKHKDDQVDCDRLIQLLEGCDAVFVRGTTHEGE